MEKRGSEVLKHDGELLPGCDVDKLDGIDAICKHIYW